MQFLRRSEAGWAHTHRITEIPMLSQKTREFIMAMIAIVSVAAFVGFVLINPGPVSQTPPKLATIHNSGKPTVAPGTSNVPDVGTIGPPGAQPSRPVTRNPRAGNPTGTMEANELFELMDKDPASIASITFLNGSEQVTVVKAGDSTRYSVTLPEQGGREEVLRAAREKHIFWNAENDSTSTLRKFVFSFGPIIIIGILWLFMTNRNAMGGMAGAAKNKMANFGKSRAKSSEQEGALRKVTFNDVAGCDEAVKELRRIAKGLRRRRLYSFFGAKLPKGVLLVGPPGTGKTLLARAVAGETDGSFDATSGSDFVEMFVGVGASRVRDKFEQGRQKVKATGKPHIIFIDEIDAVGGRRGGGTGESSNSEREQTLNAILVEMDGMKNNEGLIIIAATNRVDILDEALLRPGRFDAQVDVDLPNKAGRAAIFKIHTRNKPLAANVNCDLLAARTYGYSGAEIESASNRAALQASERYGLELPEDAQDKLIEETLRQLEAVIELKDFDEGIDFVRYGSTNESRQRGMSESDRDNTTVHEAGHAIVCDAMPGTDPIVKLTNLNRSKALGYLQNMPGEDRYGLDFVQIVGRIVTAMGGRAAQEAVLGKMDTGAANDFEQACRLAHNMVTKWGMSRVGHISVGGQGTGGMRGFSGSGPIGGYGPKLANEIDDEWRRIVEICYAMAVRIVTSDRERLDKLIAKLKEKETILAPDWEEFSKEHPSAVDKKTLVLDISKPAKKGA